MTPEQGVEAPHVVELPQIIDPPSQLPGDTRLPNGAEPLAAGAAATAFSAIFDGLVDHDELAAFLTALARRGETAIEVAAAARALRARAHTIEAPAGAIDVCGTGGDGRHTLNISTAVAIVVAACGVPVAKHGNLAASSRSGAADVLEALGIRTDVPHATVERSIAALGIGFLHAPRHHAAMAQVASVRRALGIRTIFNLLGPLANPAGVSRQLVGVFDRRWLTPFAEALRELGSDAAMVVHGSDGLDELTVTGPSRVAELRGGSICEYDITPADAGLGLHPAAALTGGDPAHNAAALTALLGGAPGAYRDIVLLNAAAALIIADDHAANDRRVAGGGSAASDSWRLSAARAASAIDSGAARALVQRWKEFA